MAIALKAAAMVSFIGGDAVAIFLDESGDLGPGRGTRFFVIAAIATASRKSLEVCVKRVRKRKRITTSELKAQQSTDAVRESMLNGLDQLDIMIFSAAIDTSRLLKDSKAERNKVYNHLASTAIGHCLANRAATSLIVDRRGDKVVREAFDDYIRNIFGNIDITHPDSQQDKALQAADFIAWAIRRKYDTGDDRFYKLIAGRIQSEVICEWP